MTGPVVEQPGKAPEDETPDDVAAGLAAQPDEPMPEQGFTVTQDGPGDGTAAPLSNAPTVLAPLHLIATTPDGTVLDAARLAADAATARAAQGSEQVTGEAGQPRELDP